MANKTSNSNIETAAKALEEAAQALESFAAERCTHSDMHTVYHIMKDFYMLTTKARSLRQRYGELTNY